MSSAGSGPNVDHDIDGSKKHLTSKMEQLTRQAIKRRLSRDRNEAKGREPDELQGPVLTGSWIYTVGADNGRIWVSEGIGRIFGIIVPDDGYVPIETISRCIPDREKVRLSLSELFNDRKEHDMEFEVVPADGGLKKIVLSVADIMEETEGTSVRISGTIWDITDILLLDSRMRRLNRELMAIKECARAVIKARNEQELWDSICRIVCEIAGYRLTWVGLAEHNDGKDIRPVAWSGYNEDYVLSVRATWGDDERSTGPAGRSIKTGRTTFIQDVLNDDRYDLWREHALKNGYRSLIAIPLMDSGEAFGALMIYSDKTNGFTSEEVELLEEMAGDLAFGIVTLRMRREREKAMDALKRVEARNRTLYDLSQMTGATSKDLTERALNSCISLSESKLGFVAFVNEDETALTMHNWSKQVMEECMVANRPYLYRMEETGSWTESLRRRRPVIVNHYSEPHANKRGLPLGHVKIERFMTVPVFDRSHIVAVLGVANKESDYTEEDATDLSLLMDGMWRIVRKLKAEEELKEHHNLLNSFAENIPDAIYIKDLDGRYLMMNPGGAALLGMESKDVLGKDDEALFGAEVAAQLRGEDREVIEERQARFYEATNIIRGRRTTYSTWKAPYMNSDGEVIGMMGYSRDISEKKEAEEALQRSEQMLKIVIDNFPGLVFWKDRNLVYLGANKESATNVGFEDPSEYVGKTDYDLPWAETEADAYRADDIQVMESGIPKLHIIERQQRLNGKFGWLDTSKVPLRDKDGKVVGILGTATDITEKKRAEDALRQANLIVENSPVMLFRWRAEDGWPVELVSNNITQFGYEPQELLDGSIKYASIIHPDDLGLTAEKVDECVRSGIDQFEQVYRIRTKDGHYRWVEDRTVVERGADGGVTHYQGIVIDITERKLAEQGLQESEERNRRLLGRSFDARITHRDGKIIFANDTAARLIRAESKEDLIGKDLVEFLTGESKEKAEKRIQQLYAKPGTVVPIIEEQFICFDGDIIDIEVTAASFLEGGEPTVEVVFRDISERKRIQEELRRSEEKFRGLVENAPYAMLIISDDKIKYLNPAAMELFGASSADDVLGTKISDRVDPRFRPSLKRRKHQLEVEKRPTEKTDEVYIKLDGTPVDVEVAAVPYRFNNDDGSMIILRDITDRKRAEEALEKRILALTRPLDEMEDIVFEDLFNISELQHLQDLLGKAWGVGVLLTRPDGTPITRPSNFTYFCTEFIRKSEKGRMRCQTSDSIIGRHNPSGPTIERCLSAGLWGAGASITVGGRHIANWLIGQVRNEAQTEEEMVEYAREIGVDEARFREAFLQVPVMSTERFEHIANTLFALANQLSSIAYQNIQQARFIAERKMADDALREANLIMENSPVMLFRWRAQEGWPVELVSKNIVRFGYEPEMFLNGSLLFSDIVHPDDLDGIKAALDDKISQGEDSYEGIYRIRSRDGAYHWVDERTFLERDSEGMVTNIQGILIDITERVEAEKRLQAINDALKEGEEKYQELFELGSEAVFLIDNGTGKVLECNTAASEMYGYSHKELLESNTRDLLVKRAESESKMIENRNGSVIIPLEYHRRKDGRMFPVEINSRYFTWKGNNVHVAAVRDITERIRTSEALRQVNKKLNLLNNITRHDLKNQMTALTGNLALAKLKRADPSFDVYMEKALASADSMTAIIKFAEAYEEIGVREAIWHDLKTLVIDSVGDVPPSKLRIINDVPAGIEVFADPLIKKVFYNLIDNAIRHGEKATTVRFSVEKVDGVHTIVCEDDGLGISADIRSKLFNRGFGKNHGLGLFLSREILAITDITMTEEGEPGKGARFVMSVPRDGIRGVYL